MSLCHSMASFIQNICDELNASHLPCRRVNCVLMNLLNDFRAQICLKTTFKYA